MEVKSNYDIQADKCKLEFIKMDHKKIAAKFNLNYDENYLYIFFYNQKYLIPNFNKLTEILFSIKLEKIKTTSISKEITVCLTISIFIFSFLLSAIIDL